MKALIKKDLLVLYRDYGKFLLLLLIFSAFNLGMSLMGVVLATFFVSSSVSYDERCGFNKLARVLPFSPLQLTLSKYLLGYLGVVGFVLINSGIQMFFSPDTVLSTALLGIFAGLFITAVNLPIIIKFGVEKGRFIYTFIFVAFVVLAGILTVDVNSEVIGMDLPSISPLVYIAVIVGVNIVSIYISLKLNKKY